MAIKQFNDFEAIASGTPPGWAPNGAGEGYLVFAASAISRTAISGTKVLLGRNSDEIMRYTADGDMTSQAVRLATNYPAITAGFPSTNIVLRSNGSVGTANISYRLIIETNGSALRVSIVHYNGTGTVLASSGYFLAPSSSDVVHFQASIIGTTLSAWLWTGSAKPSTPTVTATHSAIASGCPGVHRSDGSTGSYALIDNVVVTDGAGGEDHFYPESGGDTTAPTMTGTMTSSAITDTSFTIDWSATTRSDNVAITGYETSPDNATWTDQGNVTAKNFTGKTASTGYTTYVRAYDAAGNKSTPSLSLAVTTSAAPDTTLPVMAGSLTSASVTAGGFTLNWDAASDNVAVAGYEYSIDNGGTWTAIGNVLTKAVTGLTASTAYNTKVRAFDAAGNKATPLSLTVTTSASSDTTVPTLAGSITVSSITNTGATIAWPAGADNVAVVGYEYSIDGGTTYADNGNVLSKTLTGLTSGTAYPVRVRAYDGAGNRSTPALSATFTTTGLVTVTITKAMKNIMGGARAGVAVHVTLNDATTRALIATKTGLTLGTDGLPPSFTIVGPVAGTPCSYDLIVDGNNADYSSALVTPT